jgi:flagellar motility protein MotE (MotC chaperone)
MNRMLREFRLIPIVLVAAAALFALKVIGLVTQGGYTLGAGHLSKSDREAYHASNMALSQAEAARTQQEMSRKKSWAQEMFFPDVTGSVSSTGSTKAPTPAPAPKDASADAAEKKPAPKPIEPKREPDGIPIQMDPKPVSAAERAILERLVERRHELEQRNRELDVREALLVEAERRIETRTNELKEIESRISVASEKKDEADKARLKSLVTMYENMKAKDAARIFDRLDVKLATEVANQINPRRMSDILAQMSLEAAERLTMELASGGSSQNAPSAALPKIEGRPNGS